jgi:hypothetical protein
MHLPQKMHLVVSQKNGCEHEIQRNPQASIQLSNPVVNLTLMD